MPSQRVRTEQRERVISAAAEGASVRQAAKLAGVGKSAAHTIVHEARALVDAQELQVDITNTIARYLRSASEALEVQAQLLSDRAWLESETRQSGEVFSVASANRVLCEQVMRVLVAFGLTGRGDPPGA